MRKADVIFVDSDSEVEWAINFVHTNPKKNVKIFTPHLFLREKLKIAGLPSRDYFLDDYLRADFYKGPLRKLVSQSGKIVQKILRSGQHIKIHHTPYLDMLAIHLEIECTALLFAYDYLQRIKKKWNPIVFYISSDAVGGLNGLDSKEYIFPYIYREFFLAKKEWKLFTPTKKNALRTPSFPIRFVMNKFIYMFRNIAYQLFQNENKMQTESDLLLFSAGFNLYYYHNVLPDIAKNYALKIVTSTQSPEDEYLLHSSGIPFTPLQSVWSKDDEKKQAYIVLQVKQQLLLYFKKIQTENFFLNTTPSVVIRAFISRFEKIAYAYLNKFTKNALLAALAIDHYNPRFVLTTHDPGPSALPFVFEARARNKKSVVLLHGWNDITLGQDYYSDALIGWGPYTVSWFKKILKKKEKTLFTAGFPLLDDMKFHARSTEKPSAFPIKPMFGLLLTLYPLKTYTQSLFLEQLFDEAEKHNFKGEFWVRAHKGQNMDDLHVFSKKYSFRIELSPIESLTEFVQKSDILLAWDTTALYYPMFFHKPLFYTTPLWGDGITPVKEFKAAWIPNSPRDIFEKLDALHKDPCLVQTIIPGQKKMLEEVLGFSKNTVAKKTLQALQKIID